MRTALHLLFGNILKSVKGDLASRSLTSIDWSHHQIHAADGFVLCRNLALPAGNNDEIRIQTADTAKWPHFTFSIVSDSIVTAIFYEDTNLTHVAENILTPINRNRNSSKNSGLIICHTPAGSGDGDPIWQGAAGSGGFLTSSPGQVGTRGEIILKQNTAYLMRISGASGDAVNIVLDWYELTNDQ